MNRPATQVGRFLFAPRLDSLIGNTPLVPLRHLARPGVDILVKLESLNPGGSVKDRAARGIIVAAERAGALHRDVALLDASSGNTGIAYAMLCAERGYACEICLPAHANAERRQLLHAYGATLIITPAEAGSDGAIREARRRAAEHPDRYFYADQYNNPANVDAHYHTTAPEIWRETKGRITHFVAGLGTSGTFTGTGRRLREYARSIQLVAVQPASPFHGIEGIKHMATAIVPGIFDAALADHTIDVQTERAQAMARTLARREGLLAGVSGGANVVAALEVADRAGRGAVIVTVLPDGGERYAGDAWWHVEDVAERGTAEVGT